MGKKVGCRYTLLLAGSNIGSFLPGELATIVESECCRYIDFAHESLHGFLAHGEFRQQSFDRDRPSALMFATKHDASHTASTKQLYRVVARH